MYKRIIFADFDGTITTEDTIVGSIRMFSNPQEVAEYNGKLERGEMTLSQVVRYAFEGAPSSYLPKMLEYVDQVEIRPGFEEFLKRMKELQIPVVVISGGMRQFSQRKLEPYAKWITELHAVELDVSGPEMKVISPYDDGNELMKKTAVMDLYDYEYAIGIGDSFTDLKMAQAVDTIFARDILARYLEKIGKFYRPYENFYDVTKAIEEIIS